VVLLILFLCAAAAYLFFPLSTRVLILGIDRAPDGSFTGRSDTIILMQVDPLKPDVKMLSIPRDLWVPIQGVGENRINTAHFFAEANKKGSGPQAAIQTVEANFGVNIPYYARVRFDGFKEVVDAMGGIDVNLAQPMGGLSAGRHHLDGTKALAFARDRKGTDDFFRMAQGQFILIQAARQLINPLTWPRYPVIAATFLSVVDTNLPAWQWPRLAVALLRAGPNGADHRSLTREMVTPFTTSGGAQVLAPDWDRIHPLVQEMFGR
jgi:LCP family protein required for cell wall assembly